MPAIRPVRLKKLAAQVALEFDDPPSLVRNLRGLLVAYADFTHRPGLANPPPSLLETYRVPVAVLRQLLVELNPLVRKHPAQALAVCDCLWDEPVFECRWLAASLLGQIDPKPPQEVIGRLRSWLTPFPEERIAACVIEDGCMRLRQESISELLNLVQDWLADLDSDGHKGALWVLRSIAAEPTYQDLPSIFQLLGPYLRKAPPGLRPEILEVLSVLARRSPQETSHLLRQNLAMSESIDTAWFVRQVLPAFPADIQASLRDLIRRT